MANVSLTDFSSQQAELDRRRRMAELLQQQASAPIEVQSYKGMPAPIPWTATLGKVLGSYAAAKMNRDAIKEEGEIKKRARDEFGRFMRELPVTPGTRAEDATLNAGLADPSTLSAKTGIVDRLKGAFRPQSQASPQALGAALGGQPPQAPPMVQQGAPMPIQQAPLPPAGQPSPQAMGAALAGQPPPPPQQPMAPPQVIPQAPQGQAPQERPMAEQQQRLLEAATSGNPYLEKLAPALYEHNQSLADEDRKFDRTVAYDSEKFRRDFQAKAALQALKPEERTAMQKDFEFATQNGFKGGFMDFMSEYHPQFISPAAGQSVYNARDLVGSGGGGEPPVSRDQIMASITQQFPGARVTSTDRSPAQNAAANGVPNSAHLTGHAVDFVLGSHEEMQAAADKINAQGLPGVRALYEGPGAKNSTGPHVHVQVAQGGGGAPRPVAVGAPKPGGHMATEAEKQAQKLDPNLQWWIAEGGKPEAVNPTQASNRTATANLRKEFNQRPEVKEYRDVNTSYNVIKDLFSKPPSAAGDIAGIFSYMKMLDPGSVVREGEFATAQNAAGIPDQIRNSYNKVLNGQRLNPKQRQDFLAQAESIHSTRGKRYAEIVNEYRGYADDYGIDANGIATLPAAPGGAPRAKAYADPGKEARYQAWLKANGGH